MLGITVIPWGTIPAQPTAPFSVAEIATLASFVVSVVFGAANVTQVSNAAGQVLLSNGEWNQDPKTRPPGVAPMPNLGGLGKITPTAFVGNTSEPLILTVTGNAAGSYNFNWVGSGHAFKLTDVPAVAGADDKVVTNPAAKEIELTPQREKAVTVTVIGAGTTSELPRTATLKTTASANAAVSLSFDPAAEAFTYTHGGAAASYTLEFSSYDSQGNPASFTTAPVSAAPGSVHILAPDWTQLAAGVGTLQVRNTDGTLTNGSL